MTRWQLWGLGGVGGIFAPSLGLAQDMLIGRFPPSVIGWVCGAAVLFLLGAIVAGISSERIPLKAIAIGISLPAMVTVGNLNMKHDSPPGGPPGGVLSLLVSPAMAQDAGAQFLSIDTPASLSDYQVTFFGPGGVIAERPVVPAPDGLIPIPDDALSVAIQADGSWSNAVALPQASGTDTLTLQVAESSPFAQSFFQALGGSVTPYTLDVAPAQ